MELSRKIFQIAILLALIGAMFVPASASALDVYAEGAYTDSDLVVYIYADIDTNVVSFGVKLSYDNTKLAVTSAQKNEAVWYMGDGNNNYAYADPEVGTSGVVIIGGKLDINDPTAGVVGNRVLLGTVTFSRKDANDPYSDPSGPESYFGIGIELGKPDPYVNFASTAGDPMDSSVGFSAKIRQRGDANGDGMFTNLDFFAVKNMMDNNQYSVIADCNRDHVLTNLDFFCIKDKI